MDLAQFDLTRYLAMLPLFQETAPAGLRRIANGCRFQELSRGDDVFQAGETCHELHVTVFGQIKLFAISPAGHEKIIEIIGPGDSFPEALMFTDRPCFINAQALTESLLLSVSKESVLAEIELDARFSVRMLAGMSRRLLGLIDDVQAYALHSGVERVIGYLMRDLPEVAEDYHLGPRDRAQRVTLPASKATIASLLSISPEYFSRVLRELEDQGLIVIDKRDIHIPDPERLTSYTLE